MEISADAFGDPLVTRDAPELPDRFFDRFVFNLHPPADGPTEPSVLLGFGVHPRKDVADGFVMVTAGGVQRNLRFSTELSATAGDGAGPVSFAVVEPMATWRLVVGPNPTGVELDVVWRATGGAWHGPVHVTQGDVATAAFDHLFQPGRYVGRLTIDGVETSVDGWWGVRDRSRGVRTMSGGQGLHLWYQAEFEDRAVGFLLVEGRDHSRLLLEGGVMHADGGVDPIADVGHDLEFDAQLDLVGGRVEVVTASGARYAIDADARAGGGYMAGAGYGGHHGKVVGRDHVEHDTYTLDGGVTPKTVDTSLTDRLTRFSWDDRPGIGIFEFALTRSRSYTYAPTPRP
ncbi:MAG TPA: hypothetical protein VFG42_13955 [Baekduia sp.]|uniref:DUF7064 domain-containing protein n=1 Tax=Baekduia sp. TaxID=2600305 RepID=UPI002D77CCD5|nr:hypothetical protein [Baekduia sp.]HET6507889.1 hypothetical protein [Baekduia sp.]